MARERPAGCAAMPTASSSNNSSNSSSSASSTPVEFILLGCSSSGKTLVSRQLMQSCAAADEKSQATLLSTTSRGSINSLGSNSSRGSITISRESSGGASHRRPVPPVNAVTTPTTGMQFETIQLGGRSVTLREVGFDMARLWHKYYKKADALLYVFDACNRAQLAVATVELYRVLENPAVHGKPVILLFNKIDQSQCMDAVAMRQYIHVPELRANHRVRLVFRGWLFLLFMPWRLMRCLLVAAIHLTPPLRRAANTTQAPVFDCPVSALKVGFVCVIQRRAGKGHVEHGCILLLSLLLLRVRVLGAVTAEWCCCVAASLWSAASAGTAAAECAAVLLPGLRILLTLLTRRFGGDWLLPCSSRAGTLILWQSCWRDASPVRQHDHGCSACAGTEQPPRTLIGHD